MVQLISEIGPDIPEVARRLKQYKESVRYRYKQKILNKGFAVQAAVDHERLGLKRVSCVVEFGEVYRPYADSILSVMSELCYVVYFASTDPEGRFIVDAAVPTEHVEPFVKFIHALSEKGLFSSVDVFRFDWARNPPMQTKYYDFKAGMWDFDWSASAKVDRSLAMYTPSTPESFDYTDLLILKELQKDANKTLTEIATQLGIKYQKLNWHYVAHVKERKLIKSYRMIWMGTRYDFKSEKALHRKHRYLKLVVIVKGISEEERMELMSKTNRLPFLWFEAGGRNYFADFAFPTDMVVEGLGYLRSALEQLRGRYSYYIIDPTNALTFTIPYKLYDEHQGKWLFNAPELLARFDDLLVKIKEERLGRS